MSGYRTIKELRRDSNRWEVFCQFFKGEGYQSGIINIQEHPEIPIKDVDGNIHQSLLHFESDRNTTLVWFKDGIYYGIEDSWELEGFSDSFEEETNFLKEKGYSPIDYHSRDAIEGIDGEGFDAHSRTKWMTSCEKNLGYVPRWMKDGEFFGHEQLVKELQFTSETPPAPYIFEIRDTLDEYYLLQPTIKQIIEFYRGNPDFREEMEGNEGSIDTWVREILSTSFAAWIMRDEPEPKFAEFGEDGWCWPVNCSSDEYCEEFYSTFLRAAAARGIATTIPGKAPGRRRRHPER